MRVVAVGLLTFLLLIKSSTPHAQVWNSPVTPLNPVSTGMFVRARIEKGIEEHAFLVPQVGVTHDQNGRANALVVGPDNKVVARSLVTAGTYGTDWVVDSGLQPGDRVIVQGTGKVRPGMTVKAVRATNVAAVFGSSTELTARRSPSPGAPALQHAASGV